MAKPAAPKGLSDGGSKLWAALVVEAMPEHLVALLTEACRSRDRLDRLDLVLRGDVETWSRVELDFDGNPVSLRIDDVLVKANQTAGVLKNLLEKIPAPTAKAAPAAGGGTGLDQLAARREASGAAKSTRSRAAERRRHRK